MPSACAFGRSTGNSSDGRSAALTSGETSYEVIAIEGDWFRVIDDRGDAVLFEAAMFEVVDPSRPAGWVSSREGGEEYAGPPEFDAPGFWEDYHQRDPRRPVRLLSVPQPSPPNDRRRLSRTPQERLSCPRVR